jgi:hypothetical protein
MMRSDAYKHLYFFELGRWRGRLGRNNGLRAGGRNVASDNGYCAAASFLEST